MLHIHNSLTRRKEPFEPLEPGKVRMYVCGMTVYDYCHIGHARVLVVFDVVQRWLRASGYDVVYVRNITDIDDKIIKRAVEAGLSLRDLTSRFIDAMHEDEAALNVQPPDHEPRATEYVPQMLSLIGKLEANGLAYRAEGGDVNFSVRKFPPYGRLSGKSLDDLRAGERVAVSEGKQDPLDFVLWKAGKPEEPAEATWDGPYGRGRPGWHIECSAMAGTLLGDTLDIHGGGEDLQFPHHENEIAQSEGALFHGREGRFARFWMHNGFVRIDDQKMSKSLGNFFTVREVLGRFDAEVVRLFVLRAHYRSPLNYSDAHLEDARVALIRLYNSLSGGIMPCAASKIDWEHPIAARFKAALDDDFNTPQALAAVFDLAAELNRERSAVREAQLLGLAGILGLLYHPLDNVRRTALRGPLGAVGGPGHGGSGSADAGAGGGTAGVATSADPANVPDGVPSAGGDAAGSAGEPPAQGAGSLAPVRIEPPSEPEIEALIAERAAAKGARDFARADAIRDALAANGVILEDRPGQTVWRRA